MAFCPRCASPNIESAVACAMCGAQLSGSVGAAPQPPPPTGAPPPFPAYGAPSYGYGSGMARTNGLAIGGFVCGLLGILCGLIAIAGLIMSIIAYNQCKSSQGELRGQGFAVAGIVLSCVWLLFNLVFLIIRFNM